MGKGPQNIRMGYPEYIKGAVGGRLNGNPRRGELASMGVLWLSWSGYVGVHGLCTCICRTRVGVLAYLLAEV